MAKADPTRDYYADLELSTAADLGEIKKQFRKLALRYHPDRNPGREDEFNAKFQAIQHAHEVLTDPVQKAKYDADRARLAYGYAGVPLRTHVPPRNPYAAYSNYPPPPKPPPPRQSTASTAAYGAAPGSTGASRYTAFKSYGAPPRPRQEPQPWTNASAYRAYERMNQPRPNPNPAPFPPPPRAPKPAEPLRETTVPPRRPTASWSGGAAGGLNDPASAFPSVHRSQSTRVPRQTGFPPATPGGAEPAAPNSHAYFHGVNRDGHPAASPADPPRDRFGPTARPSTGANPPEPSSRAPRSSDAMDGLETPRLSTPYAVKGGERTYLSSSTLPRSATVRDSPKPPSADRHRSASPLGSRDHPPRDARKTTGSRTGPPTPSGSPPKGRTDPDDANSPPRPRRRNRSQPRRSQFDHYAPTDTSSDDGNRAGDASPTFMERLAAEARPRGRRKARVRPYPYPTYQSPSGHTPGVSPGLSEGPPRDARREPPEKSSKEPPWVGTGPGGTGKPGPRGGRKSPALKFAVVDESIFVPESPAVARASSTDNIDTHFSSPGWHGEFRSKTHESRAQDYFQSRPIRRKDLPTPTDENDPKTNGVAGTASIHDSASTSAAPDRETLPADWAEVLKPQTRDSPAPAPASPKRPTPMSRKRSEPRVISSRSAGVSRSSRRTAIPKPVTVSSASDTSDGPDSPAPLSSSHDVAEESPTSSHHSDGTPMDIDPSVPTIFVNAASTTEGNAMEASQRDSSTARSMERGDMNMEPLMADQSHTSSRGGPSIHLQSDPRPNGTSAPSGLGLENLRQVEPFNLAGNGLADLHDLSSSLPFPSQPAASVPLVNLEPQRLELPTPPKPSPAPAKLSQSSWEQYLAMMQGYMNKWSQFIDRMLAHFNDRQAETKERLTPNWMGIRGEGPKGGFLKYMQGVEEDFRVRAHWDVAWERHREAMVAFGQVRAMAIEKSLQSA